MVMQQMTTQSTPTVTYERTVSWLCRSDEIVAHLFFAAAQIGRVQVDSFETTSGVMLAFPHPDSGSIDIIFQEDRDKRLARGAVRVCYYHEGNSYEFLASVQSAVDDRRWRLALPNAVARWSGRGADRFSVRRDPEFMVCLEREDGHPMPHQINDISSTGVSFLYRPSQLALEEGDQLLATLLLPGDHQLPVLLEVRHTRMDGSVLPIQIAGCQLLGMSPWGRALLNQSIAGLVRH
jgi:hypothetical protein